MVMIFRNYDVTRAAAVLLLGCLTGLTRASDVLFFHGFEETTPPVAGAIIIQEIMSDPTAVSDAFGEWFELVNVSAQNLPLAGCATSDGTTVSPFPTLALDRGAGTVLARSLDTGSNGNVAASATFAFSLGPSGSIRLLCNGLLIDLTSWVNNESPGRSRALDPDRANALDNDVAANWCFANALYNAVDRGTPGQPNEQCPVTPPPGTPPGPGELSISELMIDPASLPDADAEWIELRSTATGTRDLAGCVLGNGTVSSGAFPTVVIAPGAHALAGRTNNPALNGGLAVDTTFAFSLLNGSGTVSVTCGGVLIDTIGWQSSLSGRSLQRDPNAPSILCNAPPGTPEYTPLNFGTPKANNPPCP